MANEIPKLYPNERDNITVGCDLLKTRTLLRIEITEDQI